MKKVRNVIFFNNGNVACFDKEGEQVGELQTKSWISLWLEWMESQGYDPEEIESWNVISNYGIGFYPIKDKRTGEWNIKILETIK